MSNKIEWTWATRLSALSVQTGLGKAPSPPCPTRSSPNARSVAVGSVAFWKPGRPQVRPTGTVGSRSRCSRPRKGVRDSVLAARPSTTISASVWGMYEDLWDWNTSEGLHDHDQDSLLHVEAGAVDVIVPMIYWPLTDPPGEYTDYRTLVEFFGAEVAPGRFWAGLEADYDNFAEVEAEIEAARLAGAAGVSVFAWTYVEDRGWWDDFGDGPFSQPASPP